MATAAAPSREPSADDFCFTSTSSPEDALFDAVIGELEDILMDPEFTALQAHFFDAHVELFEEDEENRLAYTPVFAEYTQRLEAFIEGRLKERVPGFSMTEFLALLKSRPDLAQEGDVFDLLATLGDFSAFKESILDYKRDKEGRGFQLDGLLSVTRA